MAESTLFEIVEGAKDGTKPTHDECYWAMLALSALLHFEVRAMRQSHKGRVFSELEAEESFRRRKTAFATSPRRYIGDASDPANPEYQSFRSMAFKVLEKVTKGEGGTG